MTEALTSEQKEFLEECETEFADCFTDADEEYKQIYDAGIPPPPIMYPWKGRPKLYGRRNRNQGDYRNNRHNNEEYGNYGGGRRDDQYRNRNRGGDNYYSQNRR